MRYQRIRPATAPATPQPPHLLGEEIRGQCRFPPVPNRPRHDTSPAPAWTPAAIAAVLRHAYTLHEQGFAWVTVVAAVPDASALGASLSGQRIRVRAKRIRVRGKARDQRGSATHHRNEIEAVGGAIAFLEVAYERAPKG